MTFYSYSTPEVRPRLTNEPSAEKEARLSWWKQDRFGLFTHFGLYAIPALHEWVKTLEKIPESHCDQYFESFSPERYDPKAWARQAKAAGMKYVTMTTKHHDGSELEMCQKGNDLIFKPKQKVYSTVVLVVELHLN